MLPVFRAEYDVQVVFYERLSHVNSPLACKTACSWIFLLIVVIYDAPFEEGFDFPDVFFNWLI